MRASCTLVDDHSDARRVQSTVNPFRIGEFGERVFIIDSGASTHLISKDWLTPKERQTIHKAPHKLKVLTANGEIELHHQTRMTLYPFNVTFKACVNPGRTAGLSL